MVTFLWAVVAIVALMVVCTVIGGDGKKGGKTEDIQRLAVPGEVTIEIGDQRSTTRISGASTRREAIPGNEFTEAAAGKVYLTFAAEVANTGTEGDIDLNASAYRLQLPTGEIVDYSGYVADGDNSLSSGTTLPPGTKKAGQISW